MRKQKIYVRKKKTQENSLLFPFKSKTRKWKQKENIHIKGKNIYI